MRKRFAFWVTAVVAAALLLGGAPGQAAPPHIDLAPSFGKAFLENCWQQATVTLTNPPDGDGLRGEVQVSLTSVTSGARQGMYIVPVTLPRGSGVAKVPVYLYVPPYGPYTLTVEVSQGRDGSGVAVSGRTFDKIPFLSRILEVLAVTQHMDPLSYLQGETLGVYHSSGVLRPAAPAGKPTSKYYSSASRLTAAEQVRVTRLPDPALLPDRALGYDAIAILYLGADIVPEAISDGQAEALQSWVARGGLLVVGGQRLRQDERFRPFLPPAPINQEFSTQAWGRGTSVTLASDAALPPFSARPDAQSRWKKIARIGIASGSMGANLNENLSHELGESVLHAPGLNAPGSGAVGLFLLLYLCLLVPVNYVILKRLDRREWSWVTVPVLVLLFSVGAYGFGYATKGNTVLQNTATVVEMGSGTGLAAVHARVGIFSPRRAWYDLRIDTPDAVLSTPRGYYGGNPDAEYGPLAVSLPERAGASVRAAEISMWAMRIFGVRTDSVRLGDGVEIKLQRKKKRVVCTITNRTGTTLHKAYVRYYSLVWEVGTLKPEQTVSADLATASPSSPKWRTGGTVSALTVSEGDINKYSRSNQAVKTREQIQNRMEASLSGNMGETYADDADLKGPVFTAWNYDRLLPVTVNGGVVQEGANVNLIIVHPREP